MAKYRLKKDPSTLADVFCCETHTKECWVRPDTPPDAPSYKMDPVDFESQWEPVPKPEETGAEKGRGAKYRAKSDPSEVCEIYSWGLVVSFLVAGHTAAWQLPERVFEKLWEPVPEPPAPEPKPAASEAPGPGDDDTADLRHRYIDAWQHFWGISRPVAEPVPIEDELEKLANLPHGSFIDIAKHDDLLRRAVAEIRDLREERDNRERRAAHLLTIKQDCHELLDRAGVAEGALEDRVREVLAAIQWWRAQDAHLRGLEGRGREH